VPARAVHVKQRLGTGVRGMPAHIHISGDASVDKYFVTTRPSPAYVGTGGELNWKIHTLRPFQVPGSRYLLQHFTSQAIRDCDVTCTCENVTDLESATPLDIVHMMAEVGLYEEKVGGTSVNIYRIRRTLGFAGPKDSSSRFLRNDDVDSPTAAVLDDIGNGFRDADSAWPSLLKTSFAGPIILKLHRPIQTGRLWQTFTGPQLRQTIVVTSCDALRSIGANISRGLSWERTAVELDLFIRTSPQFDRFRQCKSLIIRLDLDGAYLYENVDGERKATLFYDPINIEGGFKVAHAGYMRGSSAAFTAAIAAIVASSRQENIGLGIKRGIIGARRLLERGFIETSEGQFSYPKRNLFPTPDEQLLIADEQVPVSSRRQSGERWRIALTEGAAEDIAKRFVIEGRPVLEQQKIPVGEINKLLAVDRTEIESLRAIRSLFWEYVNNSRSSRPLSIAVFGPPGSGKSFSVSEVAADISTDARKPLLFNLAEFTLTRTWCRRFIVLGIDPC
jgi:hypothetical protein